MTRIMALALVMTGLAVPSLAEVKDAKGLTVKLPSGAEARWIETRHDSAGSGGLTYRFRFVMPDLARRLPAGDAASAAGALLETERGPIDIDTESEEITGDTGAEPAGDMPAAAAADVSSTEAAEEAADAMVDAAPSADPAPDQGRDPLHDDVVWLCQNWALPRVAAPAPMPSQIIISLSDKEVPFGAYDPHALQIFEAFGLSADRSKCEWEPW
ncbi:hypothetical protein GL279_04270 [Paracoccus limosus]|jgi:hypothetical protein|uniref:Uncharacterized protein n=1 Tax=Paracoccus limosus TaxID=913252 RepID=A0A844H5N9_9RHOB|nr:DUF6497 family protein [Paracoccus limosus]MTH33807.1 hypothetical protein [Paracoccus limosus]